MAALRVKLTLNSPYETILPMKNTIMGLLLLFTSYAVFADPIVSCSAKFAGLPNDTIVVNFDKATSHYKVLWVNAKKESKTLDTVKKTDDSKFEIQCLDAKGAEEIKKNVSNSEIIHDFLKIPKDKGALCYFVDDTMTKCWSYDEKTKTFINAGGWQT